LQAVHIFGMLGDQEPPEAVHRCQPYIAGRDAVATLYLQGGEKATKSICIDVVNIRLSMDPPVSAAANRRNRAWFKAGSHAKLGWRCQGG
jgi:hypothetical protein